jgi:hypothetical protein
MRDGYVVSWWLDDKIKDECGLEIVVAALLFYRDIEFDILNYIRVEYKQNMVRKLYDKRSIEIFVYR